MACTPGDNFNKSDFIGSIDLTASETVAVDATLGPANEQTTMSWDAGDIVRIVCFRTGTYTVIEEDAVTDAFADDINAGGSTGSFSVDVYIKSDNTKFGFYLASANVQYCSVSKIGSRGWFN